MSPLRGESPALRQALLDKSAAETISFLYKDVIHFAGGTSQKDDLTAIVFKRI
jgi:serine phosphatase RsbU (regulator of sigma subunit)